MIAGRHSHAVLDGYKVVDLATEIAGPYATMLLADLGAHVVRLELPDGDPLRLWGPVRPRDRESGLSWFLNDMKERVELGTTSLAEALDAHLGDADILVESFGAEGLESRGISIDELRSKHPRLVIVRISDQGQTGPNRHLPMTPLVRQAASGWLVTGRGTPGREPVQGGGRLPEFAGGAYAALGALTGVHQRRASGQAPVIDLSLLEVETATLSFPALMYEQAVKRGTTRISTAGAMLGVVKCRNGWLGINSLTGQHWLDICELMEVPHFAEAQVSIMLGGEERAQFFEAVQPWLDARDAEDVLDICQAMRIPAAPVGNGATMPTLEQYAAREFFQTDADGTVAPGSPFRLGKNGAGATSEDSAESLTDPATPFAGLRVVDLTIFWAGAYLGCYLGALGADVLKVESIQKPDGFRLTGVFPFDGDDWYELSPMYQGANLNKRSVTLDLGSEDGLALLRQLIADADVVLENFSPRVMENFGLTEDVLLELNPRLIVMRMPGFGLEGPWKNFVGWAYGIEQAAGWAWITGYEDGAPLNPGGPADPIIGAHAGVALLAALEHRRRTGEGQLVEVAQIEVAANLTAEQVIVHSRTGELLTREGNRQRDLIQGVYPAAPDAEDFPVWLALSLRHDDDWRGLCAAIERTGGRVDPDVAFARERQDEIDRMITAWTADRSGDDLVKALHEQGVPAAIALTGAHMYEDPQLRARHFFTELEHPVSGRRRYPGWPMTFSPGPPAHHHTPSPTLGQHNIEVLRDEVGLDDAAIADLRERDVIGDRPVGL